MAESLELGPVVAVEAEAIGVPGQRRFRIRAMNQQGAIGTIWLEKEQLNAVGDALETTLRDASYRHRPRLADDDDAPAVLPLGTGLEIQAAQLSLGLNRDTNQVVLAAADGQPGDDDLTAITCDFDFYRAHLLREQITSVVSSGRPLCPLCTAPMEPTGHVCVRTNGHHPH